MTNEIVTTSWEDQEIISVLESEWITFPLKEDPINEVKELTSFNYDELVLYDRKIWSYPTEKCIQIMEETFRKWWTVEDVCKVIWITYKTYKNRTNPRRRTNRFFSRREQQEMIMRLWRAKVELKLRCNEKLIKMADGNFRALMKLFDILNIRKEEEEERFNDKTFDFKQTKDYSIEQEGKFYED